MSEPSEQHFDVAIAGGGIAGSLAAWTLSRKGMRVALIDERDFAAPFFRAERISSLAIGDMRAFGLGKLIDGVAIPLQNTAVIKGGRVERITDEVDFSVPLWLLVGQIRNALKQNDQVCVFTDRVKSVRNSPGSQEIALERSGEKITSKLFVVATGSSTAFLKKLGVRRKILSRNHSSTFGFNLNTDASFQLPAASATVRICQDGADYMNIFPTPEGGFRANLFTYWPAGDDRQRNFIKGDSTDILKRLAPKLMDLTGTFEVTGDIECGSVSVMKSEGFLQPGLVLIGDAYGRICPCAGRGINKAIQDVKTLNKLVPDWIRNDSPLTVEILDHFYHDEDREAFEEWVFEESMTLRSRIVENSPKQIFRRVWYHHLPPKVQEFCWNQRQRMRRPHTTTP
ncbi:MAG: FAD-dependent monooxygenase [Verrucomicrobiales bacterium]|nr:FAD-dependent monooxygenase [Verrucomicrobiales bacterium]